MNLKKFQTNLSKTEAVLISNPTNIFYLTDDVVLSRNEREGLLVVTCDSAALIVPRLVEAGINKPVLRKADIRIIELENGFAQEIKNFLGGKYRILNFEASDLRYKEYTNLRTKLKDIKLQPTDNLVEGFRVIKSKSELDKIRRAQELTEEVLVNTIRLITNGNYDNYTEKTLAEEIDRIACRLGGQGTGFKTIVASGDHTAIPHHIPTATKLKPGALLIDLGISLEGYKGDLTRTFYIGKPSEQFVKYYDYVLECNIKLLAAISSGMQMNELQNKADVIFENYDVKAKFIHSIGHGVGLDVHEAPFVSKNKPYIIEEGNVITIEPGLYLQNEFGIRIEDMVYIHNNGTDLLNSAKYKDLFLIE